MVRERPTLMGGLPKLALAAAVVVGLIGGGAVGAATAPEGAKRNDARARAEFALADGNRYYDAARFDDAVGRYKNAINNDRTYAPAHRAKGAALAKLAQNFKCAKFRGHIRLFFMRAVAIACGVTLS